MRPLIHLLLALSLAVQGVASAAMAHAMAAPSAAAAADTGMEAMPCHGHHAASEPSAPASAKGCCGHGHCALACATAALPLAVAAMAMPLATIQAVPPPVAHERPAHRHSRPRPPDSVLA